MELLITKGVYCIPRNTLNISNYVNVNQFCYRPGVAQGVPGS